MAVNLSGLKSELDGVVNKATSLVDLADKYAHIAQQFAGVIPGASNELAQLIGPLDELDKALHKVQAILASV